MRDLVREFIARGAGIAPPRPKKPYKIAQLLGSYDESVKVVREIRQLHAEGMSDIKITKLLHDRGIKLSRQMVNHITNRKRWKDVE